MTIIHTIGFTKKSLRDFIALLRSGGIETVIDVRLRNTSQLAGWSKFPDFPYLLAEGFGIAYEHHPEFAPTAGLLDRYKKDRNWPGYERDFVRLMAERGLEQDGLDVLSKRNICLLCTEERADKCHRRLVAEYLLAVSGHNGGVDIRHL